MRPEWWTALEGGLMIGVASALLLFGNGRIAGISGILGGALAPRGGDIGWRIAFLLGLVGGGVLLFPRMVDRFDMSAAPTLPLMAVAGLLVGVGTRLGNGCTSGHGICGMSRGSPRSVTATLVFMASAALTVFMVRHVL